ncbi:MAG: DUF2723 domain-containing protein, partial [bacterium]|nr:DUF2723 domain-containing protein [bacterium]
MSGPPSFDSTDGAEFAVCGSELQIAHSPGYPLFLLLVRLFALIFSPLYGHLRLLNCFLLAISLAVGTFAFRKTGIEFFSALSGAILFLTSTPVMGQFNSLEVYPLAILLVLTAMALRDTSLSPYASGMAFFGGHPLSLLNSSLFLSLKKKGPLLLTIILPATLFLYIPVRSGACRIAHYGHPTTITSLISYFTMYSGRLDVPSFTRLFTSLRFIGTPAMAVFLLLAFLGGRFKAAKDLPGILALLFLASYELPDPAGQMWVFLLPLSLRCASGIQFLSQRGTHAKLGAALLVLVAAVNGIGLSNRSTDDIAMRWTMDVLNSLPKNCIYRPVAHDAFYAAYATHTLKFRQDVILSDPFGNYFEFSPPGQIPPMVGERSVHISRAWNREDSFSLRGLIFSPNNTSNVSTDWAEMAIFEFQHSSPDPMAMDIVAEAWARRSLQEENSQLADSFHLKALEFSATPVTRRRIES